MSKYADLAHKIVDMVHATHKEEVRAMRLKEKKSEERAKLKAEKAKASPEEEKDEKEDEEDEEGDEKKPPFPPKKDDEKGDPVGDKEGGDDEKSDDEKKDEKSDDEEEKPEEGGEEKAPPPEAGPPAAGGAEAPPAVDSMGRPMAGQGKKTPITPKTDKAKVKMSGKKEKVKVESFDNFEEMIRERQAYLNERYSYNWEEMNKEFGIQEKMIAEGMWDGNIADTAEIYGKPDISQLHIYRLLELYKAAGMNLEQSIQTIEHLYGVQVSTDSKGNLDFSDTDYSKGDTYGMNMGQNLDYYRPNVIREQ